MARRSSVAGSGTGQRMEPGHPPRPRPRRGHPRRRRLTRAPEQEATDMNSTVRDVMSTHVIAVRRSAGYMEMAVMLRDQRVSAFPVVDEDNKVIGVVSET